MRTSEVLNTAADLILERGWRQGPGGWDGYVPEDSRLCLEGGIMAALGMPEERRGALYGEVVECPAYAAVARYLDKPTRPGNSTETERADWVWHWNDAIGRTDTEVIAVLRAAALIEAAREEHAAKVDNVRRLWGDTAANALAVGR